MRPDQDYLPALVQRLAQSDSAGARGLLERAAQEHPGDARIFLLLAADHMQAQEIDRAEASYIAALQLAPDLAIARFQLGLLQFTSGRPAAALATWALLDLLDPGDPLRLFKSGLQALAQDRFDETRRYLQQGIAANSTNPALNRDMELVLAEMARRNLGAHEDGAPAAGGEGHFLVSSYGRTK